MATKIEDAVLLARMNGGVIIHTKQVLAVYPSGITKVLQSMSWSAKEDAYKPAKKAIKKTTPKPFTINSEEVNI